MHLRKSYSVYFTTICLIAVFLFTASSASAASPQSVLSAISRNYGPLAIFSPFVSSTIHVQPAIKTNTLTVGIPVAANITKPLLFGTSTSTGVSFTYLQKQLDALRLEFSQRFNVAPASVNTLQLDSLANSYGRGITAAITNINGSTITGGIINNGAISGGTISGVTITNSSASLSGLSVTGDLGLTGAVAFADSVPAGPTTNKLYVTSGDLYYGGNLIAGSAVGNWNGTSSNVYRLTGNVGLGTSTPTARLHIVNSSGGTLRLQGTDNRGISMNSGGAGSSGPNITLIRNSNDWNVPSQIWFNSDVSTTFWGMGMLQSGTLGDAFVIGNTANDTASPEFLIQRSTGNIGIGTTTPGQKLVVNGNAQFTTVTSGTYGNDLNLTSTGVLTTSASDSRLKENLVLINSQVTLEKIMQLKPYSFTWINDETHQQDVGLIAQDVAQVFPEVTFTNKNDGFMGINYSRLPALIIAALQNVVTEIRELRNRIVTKELCVGETCVTEAQLKLLLQNAGMTQVAPTPTSTSVVEEVVVPETETESASSTPSTEEVVTTEPAPSPETEIPPAPVEPVVPEPAPSELVPVESSPATEA